MSLPDLRQLYDLLYKLGPFFWLLLIAVPIMAIRVPKTRNGKIAAALAMLGLLAAFPGRSAWESKQRLDTARTRLATAQAMFQDRCKQAGEFIHKTAEDVDGVYLLKLRPGPINYGNQYRMDDPYGRDLTGEGYIQSFARGFETRQAQFAPGSPNRYGYLYVDADDPNDGQRYRYTGRIDQPWLRDKRYGEWVREFVLDKVLAPDPAPRYGVTYDDISTREERDHWIAGSSLRVIDLKTGEVMAERIGYMMDPGQGNDSGGRAPWLSAANYACPSFQPKNARQPGFSYQVGQTRKFVTKVLIPSQEQ